MEAMTMSDRYFTDAQQDALVSRRAELGPDGMRAAKTAWAELIAQAAPSEPRGRIRPHRACRRSRPAGAA
jgi:hypothetical protein